MLSDVLVKHQDGAYLLMRRDLRKATFPGLYEAGASGAILAGETPAEGALRELREETCIRAEGLTFLFHTSNQTDTFFLCYLHRTD